MNVEKTVESPSRSAGEPAFRPRRYPTERIKPWTPRRPSRASARNCARKPGTLSRHNSLTASLHCWRGYNPSTSSNDTGATGNCAVVGALSHRPQIDGALMQTDAKSLLIGALLVAVVVLGY